MRLYEINPPANPKDPLLKTLKCHTSVETSRGKIQKSVEQLRSALTRQTGHKWFWNVPKGNSLSVMFPDRFHQENGWNLSGNKSVRPEGSTSDRNIFREAATHKHRTELQEYTGTVMDDISKCVDNVTTTNTITVRHSQKPWRTGEVHSLLKTWDAAFKAGDKAAWGESSTGSIPARERQDWTTFLVLSSQTSLTHLCTRLLSQNASNLPP